MAGHLQLLAWLNEQQEQGVEVAHACLEATGTWADAIALALHEAGHKVSLVNPALIRAFGQSQLKRTKTDKADALWADPTDCALLPDASAANLDTAGP